MRKLTLFTSFDPHCFRMDFIMSKFIKIIFIFIINPTLLVLYLNGFSFHQISFYHTQQVKRALKHLFLVCSRKKHSYRCGLTNLMYSSKHLLSVIHRTLCTGVPMVSNTRNYPSLHGLCHSPGQRIWQIKNTRIHLALKKCWFPSCLDLSPLLVHCGRYITDLPSSNLLGSPLSIHQ